MNKPKSTDSQEKKCKCLCHFIPKEVKPWEFIPIPFSPKELLNNCEHCQPTDKCKKGLFGNHQLENVGTIKNPAFKCILCQPTDNNQREKKVSHLNKIIPDMPCCICGRQASFRGFSGRWFCGKDDCKSNQRVEEKSEPLLTKPEEQIRCHVEGCNGVDNKGHNFELHEAYLAYHEPSYTKPTQKSSNLPKPSQPSEPTDWEDESKILINEWVFRLIKFGNITLPKKNGGFTVFECPDLIPFIQNLLNEQKKETREADIKIVKGLKDKYVGNGNVYQNEAFTTILDDILDQLEKKV